MADWENEGLPVGWKWVPERVDLKESKEPRDEEKRLWAEANKGKALGWAGSLL